MLLFFIAWGVLVAPFRWTIGGPLRSPIPVDAIPDTGENQQIVFTQWEGRSPLDIENQITFPLTSTLLGLPGVKTIRSTSMFGISSIYIIFNDSVDFYWARSRVLEKLNSLPRGTLPEDARPSLGPDSTGMGQVFWYTLEGRDPEGRPTGGWDPQDIRTYQDWLVGYSLLSVQGVSEVASIGGFVREYQVDLDPDLMRINGVTLGQVIEAIKNANRDVGARTIEVNRVEYLIRGRGFIKNKEDIENEVIKLSDTVPVLVRNVARVSVGPALRQGVLDKYGQEAVGGVVVVRYGENPMTVIEAVKEKIKEISTGLPQKRLPDGRLSQLTIVPFYDRTVLIEETLLTLNEALKSEIIVTMIVIIVLMSHLGSSLLIVSLLPISVLLCFIPMKLFGVDANIVALSGIAIAIGTMVDMGIIMTESIVVHLNLRQPGEGAIPVILKGAGAVGGAVLTAVLTTIVGFLPVFALEGAEGKLFRPLAFTKTAALVSSLVMAVIVIPPLASVVFGDFLKSVKKRWPLYEGIAYAGVLIFFVFDKLTGAAVFLAGIYSLLVPRLKEPAAKSLQRAVRYLLIGWLFFVMAKQWAPLGSDRNMWLNILCVLALVCPILFAMVVINRNYSKILGWCLDHKALFLSLPVFIILLGLIIWKGFEEVWGWMPALLKKSAPGAFMSKNFKGLETEFMPPLDEGAFLFMPSTMPHASIGEVQDILQRQDKAIAAVPEVETVVGKLGRAETALDPAPVSMIETLITYKPCFLEDKDGNLSRFRFVPEEIDLVRDVNGLPVTAPDGKPYYQRGRYVRDKDSNLIPDKDGAPFRLWRPPLDPSVNPGRKPWRGIRSPDDIWDAITSAARIPGTTTPSKLQPISARMVMLQSGIRSKMGIRVTGPDLETVEDTSIRMEALIRDVSVVAPGTVIADRLAAKPYVEIEIKKDAAAQYGISTRQILDVIELAIGGRSISWSVEGRERYPIRVRYFRELRDDLDSLSGILVPAPDGTQIPLGQMADILYVRGPAVIKGENTFPAAYVLFDGREGFSEATVIERVNEYLREKIDEGTLTIPPGVTFSFTGVYENQVRAERRLILIIPVTLFLIFLILFFQFRSFLTSSMIFSGILVAWSGGFLMLWLYGQNWFLDFNILGVSLREILQVRTINLSVAVWVGFLALFGIASDDGVVMASYLDRRFASGMPEGRPAIRKAVIEGASRRVRPCLMTTATTVLALLPVLTSRGRGSDLMIPMAVPCFGGMVIEILTMLIFPVLYCLMKELRWSSQNRDRQG
jgi:Cu(I)/Ag(I) efflux system membrane protein CusA/SilA